MPRQPQIQGAKHGTGNVGLEKGGYHYDDSTKAYMVPKFVVVRASKRTGTLMSMCFKNLQRSEKNPLYTSQVTLVQFNSEVCIQLRRELQNDLTLPFRR